MDEEDQVVHAVAKKDSFWELLRHDRRTKIVTGLILAAIVGLGVGLGAALSRPSPTDPTEEYVPVGTHIDGPDRTFGYGPGTDSKFGSAISMSGDGSCIAVGAPDYSSADGELFRGLVQVFEERGNGSWELLEPSILGMDGGDMEGGSIALSMDGSTLAVGSPERASLEAAKAGQVMVYKRIDDSWEPLGLPILGEAPMDMLGSSVDISEDGIRVAVSIPGNGERGADEKARVYEYNGAAGDWIQLGGDLEGRFGGSPLAMSADGNTVAMGSLSTAENDHVGAIRMYEYASGQWRLMGSDIVQLAQPGSYDVLWMPSLSSDGKAVAIGSSVQNPKVIGEEYDLLVRVFRFEDGLGDWSQLGDTLHDYKGAHLISYVASLSADGNVLAIGDPGGSALGVNSGHSHVLRFVDNNWVHVDKELEGSSPGDLFGHSVTVCRRTSGGHWSSREPRDGF